MKTFKNSLRNPIGLIMIFLFTLWACNSNTEPMKMKPPMAEKIPYQLVNLGDTRVDDYYWMKLTDAQKNAAQPDEQTRKVLNYLKAENKYTDEVMEHTSTLQDKLYDEIIGRIKKDDQSVPVKENGYFYYTRYEKGGEYPIFCRKKERLDAPEEIMLNGNELAKGNDYFQIGGVSVSENNKILAYSIDIVSRRRYKIYFKNLETGDLLKDQIPNTTGGITWANDNKTLFFTTKDKETLRADRVNRYVLGSGSPVEVYYEGDETFSSHVYKTKSKKYLVIGSSQTLSTEYRILEADTPMGKFRVFQPRQEDLEYHIDHFRDYFYIRTNKDDAKNFKLMKTPVAKTSIENWTDVISHREDVLLQDFELFNNYMVLNERIKGLNNFRIIGWDGKSDYYLDFGEETYAARFSGNPVMDTDVLRYAYSSLTTPSSTFDYNMNNREKTLMKEQEVLGGFDKNNYEAKRVFTKAGDGIEVPVSLVYRKGFKKDGTHPALIYGYGSYGFSMDASFRSDRLSLLDRGFVYAIAHVRGGSEMGRQWYEDGKLLNKMNTFTDFNTCARYLVDEKYTSTDRLFAMGGSAGGLLMGAIVNLQPGLYQGVVAAVPFVDVVTTMLDESIPLTTFEFDEWGNPKEKEYYDYMLSYSPYDNVKAQDYPNLLVTTGFWDSQVQYWEPAKWVAKLRDMKTDHHLLLFHMNMEAGHGGVSGRFRRYKETAMEYAFMLDILNMDQ